MKCSYVPRAMLSRLTWMRGKIVAQVQARWGVVHVQAQDGNVHNHGNGYRDWLFYQNVFPYRESTSIMSFNGKGFTLEGSFRSLFAELWPSFPLSSIKNFFKVQWMDFYFFAFQLYYSLFHRLMIKSNYWADRALFNFLLNSFENSLTGHCFGHKDMK